VDLGLFRWRLILRGPSVCILRFGLIVAVLLGVGGGPARAATIHHYEYVFTPGIISVYDMDNGHALLKTVSVPTSAGVRGAVASTATGMLYISYGSDGSTGGFQLAYDLSTDHVAWTMSYAHGIDSQAVSPDGKKIYMPAGELSSTGTWYVEDSANGSDIASIASGGSGAHNTIVSPGGKRVYMGNRDFSSTAGTNDFDIADTATNLVIGRVTPLMSGVRPFTINSQETLAFITVSGFLGFQVGDLSAGKVIYTVPVDGSKIPGFTTNTLSSIPSHGISLSPDNKELYLIDQPNSYVHVFDVSGLPGSAPIQVADIKLVNPISGNEVGCAYDCSRNGWLHHSRDGRFVYVGDSGDVIDTLTRKTIATLPTMANTRVQIEIDFQDSTPVWASTSRSATGYVNPLPPTFTARITSPALGSTVSGSNVIVSTSVWDSSTISAVDLYKDGVLYASTTASPYTFGWDTTKDANGSHKLMITAHDTLGNTTSFLAAFTVNNASSNSNPPSITTSSLPAATQNSAYKTTLVATGGTTPYTWSVAVGTLPAGLTLASSTGVISGTPTGTGTSSFTVKVTDGASQTASKALSLTVNAGGSGGGGIGLVQANALQGSAVTSLAATFPAGNTAGNLIIAFVRMSTTSQTVALTDLLGNVYTDAVTQAQTTDGHQVHIFYAKNIKAGANTVKASFSGSNNHPWLAIYEYRGLSVTAPLDQTAHAQGSSSTPNSGPTPTTLSANELIFSGVALPSGYAGTATAGSGYTMVEQDSNTSPAANETMAATSTGGFTGTFTLSSGTNWSAVTATFKP
jgi:Putative Ig domain/Bacterial Ig domain